MYLTQDYKDIVELFNKHHVRYLIAGALFCLSIDDLIKNKMASNRPKDALDLQQLKEIVRLSKS